MPRFAWKLQSVVVIDTNSSREELSIRQPTLHDSIVACKPLVMDLLVRKLTIPVPTHRDTHYKWHEVAVSRIRHASVAEDQAGTQFLKLWLRLPEWQFMHIYFHATEAEPLSNIWSDFISALRVCGTWKPNSLMPH